MPKVIIKKIAEITIKIFEYLLFSAGLLILEFTIIFSLITDDIALFDVWQFYVITALLLSAGYFLMDDFKKMYAKLHRYVIVGIIVTLAGAHISFAVFMQWEHKNCNGYVESDMRYSRIYLAPRSIWAYKDDLKKEYRIVPINGVFHVTEKQYCDMIFFDSIADAQAAGYREVD